MRPEKFSVRAVNQYRYRDTIAYLGLRYYLDNDCSRRDAWAEDVATHLIHTRSSPIYFRSNHFKEMTEDGSVIHRSIYLPGPNEMLAESYLLHYCSTKAEFESEKCVYSYCFPDSSSKESIFRSYFPGFQKRNNFIRQNCSKTGNESIKILCTDIKKFYPSISHGLAKEAWIKTCENSDTPKKIRSMGEKILSHHADVSISSQGGLGLLTGPMFSHLIANLVLADLDNCLFQHMKQKYCRYVDDFILIGSADEVREGRKLLSEKLNELGFSLHDEGKDFEIDSSDWLECENSLDTEKHNLWNKLVANIKRFLVANPYLKDQLEQAFSENEINLPLLDYSIAVSESSYLEKLSDWLRRYSWAPDSVRNLSISRLVKFALEVRKVYKEELDKLLDVGISFDKYKRKIVLSRIKFYSKRLTYLASPDDLLSLSLKLENYPELVLQSKVMSSVYSKDVSELIKLGNDAAQSAAQIFGIQRCSVNCSLEDFNEAELQSLAILRFHEVDIHFRHDNADITKNDSLNQFALYLNTEELMSSENHFIKELACLRGLNNPISHKKILNTAFDRDEDLSFSIIDQLQDSNYF